MRARILTISCWALAIGAISGCAGMGEKFQEPSSAQRASIRFVADSPLSDNVFVHAVKDTREECGSNAAALPVKNVQAIAILRGLALAHNRKTIGMPASEGLNEKDFTELRVPADTSFAFDMYLGSASPYHVRSCNVTTEFSPRVGKLYEAVLHVRVESKQCSVTISELQQAAASRYMRVPVEDSRATAHQCKW